MRREGTRPRPASRRAGEQDSHYVPPARITLGELKRFFVVRLEPRQRKMFNA